MPDSPKIIRESGANGGDSLTVKSGGEINVETGGEINGARIERKMVSVSLTSATALSTVVPDRAVLSTELPLTVKRVGLLLNASLAGHATSNAILSVVRLSALATASTTVASKTFTTGNAVTAYAPSEITLTTSLAVAAGESLISRYTFASSGQDVPIGQLTVEFNIDPS